MPLCFVIGPIGKQGSVERKHSDLLLHAVIKPVLTPQEFGYDVKRADEDDDPGMIGDRVVSDIINAELVVADLTDLNPNAFYELGIRHSTQKPTIHMAKTGTVLPFDNISHRTIFVDLMDWHSQEQARASLTASARRVREPGYKVTNPITQANASFKMRESDDPRDRVLAGMLERLGSLERATRHAYEPPPPRGDPWNIAALVAIGDYEEASVDYSDLVRCGAKEGRHFIDLMSRRKSGEPIDLPAAAEAHAAASGTTLADATRFVSFLSRLIDEGERAVDRR